LLLLRHCGRYRDRLIWCGRRVDSLWQDRQLITNISAFRCSEEQISSTWTLDFPILSLR
jgi:hypothetical protein